MYRRRCKFENIRQCDATLDEQITFLRGIQQLCSIYRMIKNIVLRKDSLHETWFEKCLTSYIDVARRDGKSLFLAKKNTLSNYLSLGSKFCPNSIKRCINLFIVAELRTVAPFR